MQKTLLSRQWQLLPHIFSTVWGALSHAVEEDSAGRLATETAVSTRALTTQTLVESPFPLAVSTCAQVPINCSRELTLEGP